MDYKNILVVNSGSTSTKYKLFSYKGNLILNENFDNKKKENKKKEEVFLRKVKSLTKGNGIKIAFRVVHGGDILGPVILDRVMEKRIGEFIIFAPIHNKLVLKKISKLKKIFQKDYQEENFFAFFDTDFHRSIPEKNYTYPIDQEITKKYKIRKYGFHGLAVESVLNEVEKGFKKRGKKMPEKIIFAHLGGGSSLTAVKNRESIANTMGLTPISGLMMTTRVGDVDSDLDKILAQKMGKSINIISEILSKKSGFLGLTGSSDTREIFKRAKIEAEEKKEKYQKEKLAFDIYLEQIIQKIGGYVAMMGGLDLLVFSGGIGEGNSYLRKKVLDRLEFLNFKKEQILVINSDEEKLIFQKIKDNKF